MNTQTSDRFFIIKGNDTSAFVILVGKDGSLYGFKKKYLEIAETAHHTYGNTVFIFNNPASNWNLQDNGFSFVMNTVKNNMGGSYEISFFGFSAGASFAMLNAWKYPEIKRMLLVNPPLMVNFDKQLDNLKLFKGFTTLIIGEFDQSAALCRLIEGDKETIGINNLVLYENADHQFTGLLKEFIQLPFSYLF